QGIDNLLTTGRADAGVIDEGGDKVADANLVAVLQQGAAADPRVVDEGAVAALAVLDEELVLLAHDLGVLAADGGDRNVDVAVRVAPEDVDLAVVVKGDDR